MSKDMRLPTFHPTPHSRIRPVSTTLFILLLCALIPISLYQLHLLPTFTPAPNSLIHSISSHIQQNQQFCTKQIGTPECCALYLDATPCLDECQKQHVDRATFALTREFDECVDVCLGAYYDVCRP